MLFSEFSQHLSQIEQTSSRLEMMSLLARLLAELKREEIPVALYISLGKLVPEYQSLEFQLSTKMVLRVLVQHMVLHKEIYGEGLPVSNLFDEADDSLYERKAEKLYKEKGDIGETAQVLFSQMTEQERKSDAMVAEQNLTILEVHAHLKKLAEDNGTGSQERKTEALLHLLQQLDPVSIRFVTRMVVGKLRLGFSTMTIFDALSWLKNGSKVDTEFLEELFQRKADIGVLAQVYLDADSTHQNLIDRYQATLGIPVVPALCQRLNSAQEIIEKMGKVIAEPKYDGLRIQIHINKGTGVIRSFTRNLEETSLMFPELKRAEQEIDATTCILDGEVVGIDIKTGDILAFQETSTRRRKHGVEEKAAEIPVHFYVFDVMEKDGQSLIDTPLHERKEILQKMTENAQVFIATPFIVTSDPKELKEFHEEQLIQGLEGAVIKKYDSVYKSGRKGWRWVKIKEEEGTQGKLNDTLDCVVMGYYRGRGKRASFGMGAFLVGVLGNDSEILTVAKIGTGLTDEQFRELKGMTDPLIVPTMPKNYEVHKNLIPDVWVEPSLVVEIAADEITRSPVHSAGKALRFPRLSRFRTDKKAEQATTVEELKTISHLE